MDLVDSQSLPWTGPLDHRQGGIEFRKLFTGTEGAPDNYLFTLVRARDYYAPPHRHNFDQVRIMLGRHFGFGPQMQTAGQVGYLCEGTTYEQQGEGYSVTLLLQTSNASRSRYLSEAELIRAIAELKKRGRFERGTFIAQTNGHEIRLDGYEAAWQEATGQSICYDPPRYDRPVIMDPERFAYIPYQTGAMRKRLGVFSERSLEIGLFKLDTGAELALSPPEFERTLLYVVDGGGRCDDRSFGRGGALRKSRDEQLVIAASAPTVLYYLCLPR